MTDKEMAEFLQVNGIGGSVALDSFVQESSARGAQRSQHLVGDEAAVQGTQTPLQPGRVFGLLRALLLLCGSALSCCVATSGLALLFFLLVSRALAPAAADFQRDLYFDFTKPDVVATASFLFTGATASAPPLVKVQPARGPAP